MYFDEQQDSLNNQVPKYLDISKYVFRNSPNVIDAYSDISDSILYPIPRVLLQLYQQYIKINFKIEFKKWTLNNSKSIIDSYPDIHELITEMFETENNHYNKLYVVHITRGSELFEMAKNHEKFDKNIGLALQIEQNHKIAVIKVNEHTTVIFTNKYDTKEMQTYYSIVPIVFSKENLPEELVKTFLELYNKNYTQIIEKINILFENIDITEMKLEHLKKNLTIIFKNTNGINQIDNDIANLNQTLNSYYDEIIKLITNIKEKELRKVILMGTDFEQHTSELIEYMNTNKFITDIDIQNNYLYITIKTPIYFVDEKFIQRLFDTPKSYLHGKPKIIKDLVQELFLDKKSLIIVKAKMAINISAITSINTGAYGGRLSNIVSPTSQNLSFTDSVPQPHLIHYKCFGGNETHILKNLQNNDIIGFIAQIIASCQNINFGDQVVTEHFLKDITDYYSNTKCIIDTETNEQISYNEWQKRRFSNETNTN